MPLRKHLLRVHFIHYTPEMAEARSRGELRTTSFVRLRKLPVDRALMLDVIDLGDAETLLNNPRHFRETARRHLKRGIPPTEDGWGGCLGRYQSALCKATREIESATSGTGFASRSGAGIARDGDNRPDLCPQRLECLVPPRFCRSQSKGL
jgi:hypothetical protein